MEEGVKEADQEAGEAVKEAGYGGGPEGEGSIPLPADTVVQAKDIP